MIYLIDDVEVTEKKFDSQLKKDAIKYSGQSYAATLEDWYWLLEQEEVVDTTFHTFERIEEEE